jgi:hypothetical protein
MKGVLLLACILFSTLSYSQENDSLSNPQDSVKPHSVRKAVILSACVPGAGQIYNHIAMPKGKKKAFWKVPLIYAGLGASTYFLISNQLEANLLKEEYLRRDEGIIGDNKWQNFEQSALLTFYDQHQTWRDLSILAVAGVYVLQIIDAGVEAHFVSFDISEDLSLKFEPTLLNYRTAGLRMRFNFH